VASTLITGTAVSAADSVTATASVVLPTPASPVITVPEPNLMLRIAAASSASRSIRSMARSPKGAGQAGIG
jgi:hypothetical protein